MDNPIEAARIGAGGIWARVARVTGSTVATLVPVMAIGAPLLTGIYYLWLASGSAEVARQMMLVTDPVRTALALSVAFFPALLAIAAIAALMLSWGRFHLATAYWLVFVSVVFSGPNLDLPVRVGLSSLSASCLLLAWLVPIEYPGAMVRFVRDRSERPQFEGRVSQWVRRHPRLDRIVVPVAIGTFVVNVLIVVALAVGIFVNQFTRPALYELTFEGEAAPVQVVWFSMEPTGTWFVTETSQRDIQPGTVATRDLEWSPAVPASVVVCGANPKPCAEI